MVVGEVSERCDVAVIGGGPGGYVAALRCAAQGRSVVLIERDRVGGTCLNVGCIPSKVLIHAAELASLPALTADTGVVLTTAVDPAAMRDHRAAVVAGLTNGVQHLLSAAGVQQWRGTARFARRNRLVIETEEAPRHLEFTDAIIATGSQPIELPSLPWGTQVLDSTGALDLAHIPRSMAVVGGGYIGIELGTAFAKLGSSVTVVEAQQSILSGMDGALRAEVARGMQRAGITTMLETTAVSHDGESLLVRAVDDSTGQVEADLVVVAVGRRPNTNDLGLEVIGVSADEAGRITVDKARRAAPGIYAIGDVTEGPALAHKATSEAAVAAATICGATALFDPAVIPEVVFSDPEIASVGHTPDSADQAGIVARHFRFPLSANARAATTGNREGFAQLVADEAGTIIGAQFAGSGAAESVSQAALAIEMAATVSELADVIHAHPTLAEATLEAALGLDGRPLHISS